RTLPLLRGGRRWDQPELWPGAVLARGSDRGSGFGLVPEHQGPRQPPRHAHLRGGRERLRPGKSADHLMRRQDRDTTELEDLRRENERLRSGLTLLEAERTQDTRLFTRTELRAYCSAKLGSRVYRGVDGVVSDVFDIVSDATRLYGKDAVRKALYLDD